MAELLYELLTSVDPPVKYLIGGGILPTKAKCIIAGSPKANKSWVALNMALSLAQGKPLFNAYSKTKGYPIFPVFKPCRVLYFEQELGRDGTKDRLRSLTGNNLGLGLDLFLHTRDVLIRMDTPEGKEAIEREIEAIRPQVVFLDPFSKLQGVDEDKAQQVGQVLRFGDYLMEKFDVSIVLVHHTSKPTFENPKRGGDRLRGSSALFGDCDSLILVNRKSAEDAPEPIIELSFELRRGEPMRSKFVRRLKSGEITYIGDSYTENLVPDRKP